MKIDHDLIKKKSEHNEGLMEDLEEISLHQLQIKKIEFINIHCRNLKILLLQNNLIEKIENLNQLKKLEYLNLALNNITIIENLEKCESLKKIDLTLNFIDIYTIEKSINNLKKNENLKELYLMGNPCSSWKHFKHFVIFHLDHLEVLDGCDILVSDKIKSKQTIAIILKSLEEEKSKNDPNQNEQYDSINNRKKIYEEIEKEEIKNEAKDQETNKKEKEILSVYTDDGHIRQCNEGHYKFMFDEYSSNKYTFLKVYLPKYLCNSLIEVDINVNYVRCLIKKKLFQIKLNDPILTDCSKICRKKYTGELSIKMKKKYYKKNTIFESEYIKDEQIYNSDATEVYLESLESSSSSSDDSSVSFFKNKKQTFKKKVNDNSIKYKLTDPNENKDNFYIQEKQTTYSQSIINQLPSLEKISKPIS
ncbi:leucine-rich repeat protein [Plasmodium chabaudi chabaudi]|uniref:Leucine-rich repeat protein n=1 Tax=Plasmodium chabaudi chabaudi TaxID=31271 RepID=A0A1D3S4D6_PLACU|nr:leucine-rich repeat protein [Plasmodium chabaudi chabaudi]